MRTSYIWIDNKIIPDRPESNTIKFLLCMEFQLILLSVLLWGANSFTDMTYDFVILSRLHFLFAHLNKFPWNAELKLVG